MISQVQKQILFNVHCYYQFIGHNTEAKLSKKVEMAPEILIYGTQVHEHYGYVNWDHGYLDIVSFLATYDLSTDWLNQLSRNVIKYVQTMGDVQQFREIFKSSLELNFEMLNSMASPPLKMTTDELVVLIVNDIFDKDYWEGKAALQVKYARKLKHDLGFTKDWVIEIIQVLLRNSH